MGLRLAVDMAVLGLGVLSGNAIPDAARIQVIYDGAMHGTVTVADRSRDTRVSIGGLRLNVGGSRDVPVDAGYHLEVTYDGKTVTGVERQTSATRGASGNGSFRGTRNGDQCDIITGEGHHYLAHCTLDAFEYDDNYTNPQNQRVKSHYSAQRTALVDLVEQERKQAAARAEAEKQAAIARVAAEKQRVIDEQAARKEAARQAAIASANPVPKSNVVRPASVNVNAYVPTIEAMLRSYFIEENEKVGYDISADRQKIQSWASKYQEGSISLLRMGPNSKLLDGVAEIDGNYIEDVTYSKIWFSGRTDNNIKRFEVFIKGKTILCADLALRAEDYASKKCSGYDLARTTKRPKFNTQEYFDTLMFVVSKNEEDSSGCLAYAYSSSNETGTRDVHVTTPIGTETHKEVVYRDGQTTYVKNVCTAPHKFYIHLGFFAGNVDQMLKPGDVVEYSCSSSGKVGMIFNTRESSSCQSEGYFPASS